QRGTKAHPRCVAPLARRVRTPPAGPARSCCWCWKSRRPREPPPPTPQPSAHSHSAPLTPRRPSPPPALQLRRNAPIAAFGRALEEQRLARDRRDRRRLEPPGEPERRLRARAGEVAPGGGGE